MLAPRGEKTVRVLEETTERMLTGPAYSPDGKDLCYLRVPLWSREQHKRLMVQRRKDAETSKTKREASRKSEGLKVTDLSLPSIEETAKFFGDTESIVPPTAVLVIRDAVSGDVRSTLALPFPPLDQVPAEEVNLTYMLTRPQYGPDGKWIYFFAGGLVMGVDPAAKEIRLLAANGLPVLSPDGKTMAIVSERCLGFVSIEGDLAVYKRVKDVAWKGVAWRDKDTLAALSTGESRKQKKGGGSPLSPLVLTLFRRDGSTISTKELKVEVQREWLEVELAVAPDGKHMVVVHGEKASFLDGSGETPSTWEEKGAVLFQPTFTLDSKQIAFKYAKAQREPSAIIFFTPEGKELFARGDSAVGEARAAGGVNA